MIKSFLKKVFSSSSSEEVASSTEQLYDQQAESDEGVVSDPIGLGKHEMLTIRRDSLTPHSLIEINQIVSRLYERAEKSQEEAQHLRLRIQLDEDLQGDDIVNGKRIGKYLAHAEQEIVDLTYFLDKNDPITMDIYRQYLLPEDLESLNPFLQERCLMIYETSVGLLTDHKKEIEEYFKALDIPMAPSFFEEFNLWIEEVLRQHDMEQYDPNEQKDDDQDRVMIKVSKEEVENENIQQIDHYLKAALQSPETARQYKGTLLFSFFGFSKYEDLVKLMNRKEVNDWASLLVEKHPYIFYFLNDEDYPMTPFLTSLVVTTEVEEGSVYYNDEELIAFKEYVIEALITLADWIQEDKDQVVNSFNFHFSEKQ